LLKRFFNTYNSKVSKPKIINIMNYYPTEFEKEDENICLECSNPTSQGKEYCSEKCNDNANL